MMRNRIPLLLAILLLTVSASFAATTEEDGNSRETSHPAPGSENEAPNDKGKHRPATTFTPSEKIGADSAVSFPVDI